MRLIHRRTVFALVLALAGSGCASSGAGPASIEEDTRIAVARRNIGIDHLANGRAPMAIRELRVAYDLNPADPVTLHWLGEAYRRRGLFDKALEHFLKAVARIPDDPDLRLNLAGLYVQLERYPEAIEQYQILIDDPTFSAPWKAYSNKGWAELQQGQVQEARLSLEEALAYRPTYWRARLNLGILDIQEGHKLQAIVNFEKVLERNVGPSAEAETHYRLGETYVSMGRRDKAVEYFMLAAERAPYERWGRESEEYLKRLH